MTVEELAKAILNNAKNIGEILDILKGLIDRVKRLEGIDQRGGSNG